MNTEFTYEHWEGKDEYIVLGLGGPIGYTVTKKDAEVITKWLNGALPELRERIEKQAEDWKQKADKELDREIYEECDCTDCRVKRAWNGRK